MFASHEIAELHGTDSILLIGRRVSFGQLNRFERQVRGMDIDPHCLVEKIRRFGAYPGNTLKLRSFWFGATGGCRLPRNDQDLAIEISRIVTQGTWMALELPDEKGNLGATGLEKSLSSAKMPLSALRGRNVATLSMDEKFALTFEKVPNYLDEGFADAFRALVSPAAIGTAVATLAVLVAVSGGTIVAIIAGIGYALAGWAIFGAIGDLIDAIDLVANASDDRDLDRAAKLFARVAAELTVGVMIAILTRGAGRVSAGGKGRFKAVEEAPLEPIKRDVVPETSEKIQQQLEPVRNLGKRNGENIDVSKNESYDLKFDETIENHNNIDSRTGKGLGNPFKNKNSEEIHEMFERKGFRMSGPDPINGKGGYINEKTGRSYHIDPKEYGKYREPNHVDVNRVRDYTGKLGKKKLPYKE